MNFLQKSFLLYGTRPGVGRAGMSGHAHVFQTNLGLSSGLFQLGTCTGQAPDLQRCPLSCSVIITAPTLHQPAAFRGEKFHNPFLLLFPHKTWSSPAQNLGLCCSKLISGLAQLFLLLGKGGVEKRVSSETHVR